MKKITKLTKEQELLMPICMDYWISKGLQTGEADWETFDKNIKLAYEKANLKFPDKIIRVNSPVVGAIAASISDRILNNLPYIINYVNKLNNSAVGNDVHGFVAVAVNDAVNDAVRGAVGGGAVSGAVNGAVNGAVSGAVSGAVIGVVHDAVRVAVGGAVNGAVNGAVGVAVVDSVRGAVGGAVNGAVGVAVVDSVRDAVSGAVRDAVGGAVSDAVFGAVIGVVHDAVRGAVHDAVRGAVDGAVLSLIEKQKLSWHNVLGGQFWVGGWYWGTAYISFFIDYCGLEVNNDIKERYEIYKSINSSVNYIWCNKDFVIVCNRPKKINLNSQGQLHSIEEKSIIYPDGWGMYSFNGVTVEEKLFHQLLNKEYTFDMWTKEKNEEIKSLVLAFYEEKFGGEFVFRFLSKYLKETDTYVDKKEEKYLEKTTKGMNIGVYTLFKGKVNNIDISYVRCYCPSTDRMFFLGVNPDINNAKDAIASLCQIPLKLKDNLISINRQGEIFSFKFDEKGTKKLKNNELTKEDYSNVVSLKGNEYFSKLKFEY
jgi:hypothetical protein